METKTITSRGFFRSISVPFYFLILSVIIFTLIGYFLQKSHLLHDEVIMAFMYIVPSMDFLAIVGGYFLFEKKMSDVILMDNLFEKLNNYRSALFAKYAFFQVASYITIVSYLITGNRYFLVMAAVTVFPFIFNIPTVSRVEKELELNRKERAWINNPETVLSKI